MSVRHYAVRLALALAALAAAVLPAACGDVQWPPRDGALRPLYRPAAPPSGAAAPRRAVPPGGVVVRKGDTVYGISRRFGVPVRGVIEANSLRPPYTLYPGQRLSLPLPRVHVVQPGDTLYSISRAYGVDVSVLARANGIGPPYTITPGQRLALPASESAAVPTASREQVVRPAAAIPSPPPRQGRFQWPVAGRLLSEFGAKGKGLHNDGINIAAPRGSPVHAAESGVVAYAGNELRGFGNLLLIKHADGWVTAYAHNETLLVGRGDRVRRGQVISRVGSSGNVAEPQLHFELRRGRKAVDPRQHLDDRRA